MTFVWPATKFPIHFINLLTILKVILFLFACLKFVTTEDEQQTRVVCLSHWMAPYLSQGITDAAEALFSAGIQ
jgi:uncharacterized membrane protein YkgB